MLKRKEQRYGLDSVHRWQSEGIPLQSMGYQDEMADHRIQRAVEGTGTSREDIPGTVLEVVAGDGEPLPDTIQRSLESRMDADFSDVRIQRGPKAAEACDAIGAKAFTCGNKIAFNSGEYDPTSPEGQHLLAHELAHVKQQTGGAAISMMPQEGVELEIDPDPQLEREADEAAKQALEGGPVVVNQMGTEMHIQRQMSGSSAGQVTDTTGMKQDAKVVKEAGKAMGKEFTKRFIPNEFMAGYEAAKAELNNQQTDELAELTNKLESITPPDNWKQSIADYTMDQMSVDNTGEGSSTGDAKSRRA